MLTRLAASGAKRTPKRPRALILAPTRELASQINATLAPLAKALGMRSATIFGGVGAAPQIAALKAGLDVLVACPGRLEEHVRDGQCRLDAVEITVLDEADHMCDLGFLPGVRRLLEATPPKGQRMLFSATLDSNVEVLVRRFLHNPVTHSIDPPSSPVEEMTHHVLHLQFAQRLPILVELTQSANRTMVFTRTKHKAKSLTKQLNAAGVPAVELHGNLAQNARVRNLAAFADGTATTLVATDIAARGIHVDEVALVIHSDPPEEHKAYLHRSGRTARAGASGTVVTFMTDDQQADVRALTKKAGISPTITKVEPRHPLLTELAGGGAPTGPGTRPIIMPAADSTSEAELRRADREERKRAGSRGGNRQGSRPSGAGQGARSGAGSSNPRGQSGRGSAPAGGTAAGGGATRSSGQARPVGGQGRPASGERTRSTGGASGRPASQPGRPAGPSQGQPARSSGQPGRTNGAPRTGAAQPGRSGGGEVTRSGGPSRSRRRPAPTR